MDSAKANRIFQAGRDRGADFVEIFEEETRHAGVSFKDGKVESASAGTDYGIGIRLLFGTEVLYAHTSKDELDHILKLIEALTIGRGANILPSDIDTPLKALQGALPLAHRIAQDPRKVGQENKLDILRRADAAARRFSDKITQVQARAADTVSDILIANSDGLWATDTRTRSRFHVSVTAAESGSGGEMFTAGESPGAQRGFEFFEGLDAEKFAGEAAERAVRMLSAGYVQGGKMPVVMGNGFGGVIFHEACGHLLETEGVRRKASVFAGKLGEQIAHSEVTAIDDGTIENSWGSIGLDDEGRSPQKTTLIENGVLKTYMSDRVGAHETGVVLSGSARRESYQYAPVSRMRNTYIAAGKHTPEAVIASVEDGLYAKKLGGGSVNPATGEFNFAVEEGYRIRGGKIAEPVRGATLIGKGPEILPKISMVANDLELAAGICGASSGSVPVTVGQPTLKVDSILVGGR
ncbi:MAG TPA: TldD/PmbA family protein [Fibrobacteria bacterium]|jgi:TldD protein|nr:TldD/PmbA family protein [Fibrobacteria bacterium]